MALYRHKKRGTLYRLIGFGKMQADDWQRPVHTTNGSGLGAGGHEAFAPADMVEVAVYQSEDDEMIWVRPREEFEDGRFEVIS